MARAGGGLAVDPDLGPIEPPRQRGVLHKTGKAPGAAEIMEDGVPL